MIKVNRKIEYALIALKYMENKEKDSLTSVKEICDLYNIPFDVMSKVMQKLTSRGILKSEKGAHGGYYINCDLMTVSMLKLYEDVMGAMPITKCLDNTKCDCAVGSSCNVISPMIQFYDQLHQFFKNIKVGELLKAQRPEEQIIKMNLI